MEKLLLRTRHGIYVLTETRRLRRPVMVRRECRTDRRTGGPVIADGTQPKRRDDGDVSAAAVVARVKTIRRD